MKVVNIHVAKTHLSRLIKEALEGEEIVIARGNEPVGWVNGKVTMAPDFDAPLDDFSDYR